MIKNNLESNSKISFGMWMFLIGVALFFDAIQALIGLIPFVGQVGGVFIDMFAFATFWLIFKMNGETYSKKTILIGFIIGFVPFINMLPECTATIVKLYFDTKTKKIISKIPAVSGVVQNSILKK